MPINFWNNKKVLVTGAGGFIGSHLTEALIQKNADVRAFVRYNSRGDNGLLKFLPKEFHNQFEIISGDLRDQAALQEAMKDIQVILHLGALIAIPYSYLHPVEVVQSNILGTLNLLMAARNCPTLERLVHTSTSEVYGTAMRVPIDESHPLQGQSPYSASKIGADKLVESFFCAYELPVVTLRPFNTYGPRQSARAVIPTIISQALTQPRIRLGNLEAKRDLTYVSDTVEGFLLAGETSGIEGRTINLGSGSEITIHELATEIIKQIGQPIPIEIDNERKRPTKSEVGRLLSDNSLAKKILGWEPKIDLANGLQHTIAWIKENIGQYHPERYEI